MARVTLWVSPQKFGRRTEDLAPYEDPFVVNEEVTRGQEITLSAFYCSKSEMTQGQWPRVFGSNPSQNVFGDGLSHPLESVSHDEAVAGHAILSNGLSGITSLTPALLSLSSRATR